MGIVATRFASDKSKAFLAPGNLLRFNFHFMDTFIITGANAEPAQSIARRLCEMGARVYGIAGTFPEADFAFNEFFPVACDVTSPQAVSAEIEKILEREKTISGLIFTTQYLACDAFESMPLEEITLGINALVTTPLVIARLALPSLITSRGSVIAVSSNTLTPHGHVLNGIADAAMKVFAGTLFGELRDTGVKTCHIFLQNNSGAQDPAAAFTNTPQSRIQPDIVAETVETVLRLRENNALTQIVLRPQATRETPRIPVSSEPRIRTLQVVRLPESKNYPPAEEPILTPKYCRPDYAPPRGQKLQEAVEEAMSDAEAFADDYVDPELRYLVKGNEKREERAPAAPATPPVAESPEAQAEARPEFDEEGNPIRRKRKRRRKKKNRNGAMLIQPPKFENQNAPANSGNAQAASPTPSEPRPVAEKAPEVPAEQPKKQAAEVRENKSANAPEAPKAESVSASGEGEAKKSEKLHPKKKQARPRGKKAEASAPDSPEATSKPKKPRKPRKPKEETEVAS